MGLKCGIVGLPNVGKSTLFNALTAGKAAAENYAFCTIDQNIGIAEIADSRLAQLAAIAQSEKSSPTAVEFVDIAGLVRGASQNAGLGNRFLSHIREAQGIAHVARCFVDGDIAHVEGRVRPREDIDIVNLELSLADLATVEKIIERNRRPAATGEREARAIVAVAEKIGAALAQGLPARAVELNEREAERARAFFLLTAKPVLYVANVDEDGIRRQSVGGRSRRNRARRRRAFGARLRAPRSRNCRHVPTPKNWSFCAIWGSPKPASGAWRGRRTRCSDCRFFSPPGAKRRAPLDFPPRHLRARGGGRHSHRFRQKIHPRRSRRLGGIPALRRRDRRARSRKNAARRRGLYRPRRRCDSFPRRRLARRDDV